MQEQMANGELSAKIFSIMTIKLHFWQLQLCVFDTWIPPEKATGESIPSISRSMT